MIVCDVCGRRARGGGYTWAVGGDGKDYCGPCIRTLRKPKPAATRPKLIKVRTCCPGILKRGRHDKACRPAGRTRKTGVTR